MKFIIAGLPGYYGVGLLDYELQSCRDPLRWPARSPTARLRQSASNLASPTFLAMDSHLLNDCHATNVTAPSATVGRLHVAAPRKTARKHHHNEPQWNYCDGQPSVTTRLVHKIFIKFVGTTLSSLDNPIWKTTRPWMPSCILSSFSSTFFSFPIGRWLQSKYTNYQNLGSLIFPPFFGLLFIFQFVISRTFWLINKKTKKGGKFKLTKFL